MSATITILSLAALLFRAVAGLVMTIWFLPYRMLSRLSEKMISTPRSGGWETSFIDQIKLDLATRMAMNQAVQYELYPGAANRALRITRALGMG